MVSGAYLLEKHVVGADLNSCRCAAWYYIARPTTPSVKRDYSIVTCHPYIPNIFYKLIWYYINVTDLYLFDFLVDDDDDDDDFLVFI